MDAEPETGEARRALGFLDVRQTAALAGRGITVLEPRTTLVAAVGFYGLLLLLGLDPEDRTFVESILRRVRAK